MGLAVLFWVEFMEILSWEMWMDSIKTLLNRVVLLISCWLFSDIAWSLENISLLLAFAKASNLSNIVNYVR